MKVRLYVCSMDYQEISQSKELVYEYEELFRVLHDARKHGYLYLPKLAGAEIVPTDRRIVGYKIIPD